METTISKRQCRQCNEIIPNNIWINGKRKTLCNRRFCIKCSPYGSHNTSAKTPEQRSRPARRERRTTVKQREAVTMSLYKRGLERKTLLISQSGGGCIKCGYNKSRRAMTFHHRDRATKTFGLSINQLWSKSWDIILKEWEKCDLLCMNCHAEMEDSLVSGDNIVTRVNKKYGTNF